MVWRRPRATKECRWRLRDNTRKIGKSEDPLCNEFHAAILLGPVFFRTALPCSGGYHLARGGMPLHDTVGINCKKGATNENQGAGVNQYKGCGVYVYDRVCVIWLEMTTPRWWREKVMVYYIIVLELAVRLFVSSYLSCRFFFDSCYFTCTCRWSNLQCWWTRTCQCSCSLSRRHCRSVLM